MEIALKIYIQHQFIDEDYLIKGSFELALQLVFFYYTVFGTLYQLQVSTRELV